MLLIEILTAIACVLIVSAVIVREIVRRKRGKGCCDCADCPNFSACERKNKIDK